MKIDKVRYVLEVCEKFRVKFTHNGKPHTFIYDAVGNTIKFYDDRFAVWYTGDNSIPLIEVDYSDVNSIEDLR